MSKTQSTLKNPRSKSNKRLTKFTTKNDPAGSSKEDQKLGDSKIRSKSKIKLDAEEMAATIESSAAEDVVATATTTVNLKTSSSNPNLNLLT